MRHSLCAAALAALIHAPAAGLGLSRQLHVPAPHVPPALHAFASHAPPALHGFAPHAAPALHAFASHAPPKARLSVLPPLDERLRQDPADSLWRAAREAVNRGDHARAADMYRRLRSDRRFATSAYRAPSYYWEAFTRHRLGSRTELQHALRVLEELRRDHPQYDGMAEADRLRATINGQLAQLGSADASRNLAETASRAEQCDETQLAAVEALMHMSAADAMPILRRVMQRRDCDRLREQALFIMAQKDPAEAESILLDVARNDPSPRVRESALMWLATTGSDRALDLFGELIRSSRDRRQLEAALMALGQQRSERTTALLRSLIARSDAPADARATAIHMLGDRRDPELTTMLRNLYTQNTDRRIREAILFALAHQRSAANVEWLVNVALDENENIDLRTHALLVAGESGAIPLNRLVELYGRTPNRRMREQIFFAITQVKSPDPIPSMIEIVRNERDPNLRRVGIHWLSQTKDPRALAFIAEIIGP